MGKVAMDSHSSPQFSYMKGYSFTFGGYRRLDHIDGEGHPVTFLPDRRGILRIKSSLEHPIFGIDGVMATVRDYVAGGALLPTDLFPPREVDTNEAYQVLYSVACCVECTGDVVRIVRELPTYTISLIVSRIRMLHLLERYRFLGNEGDQKEFASLCNSMGINTLPVELAKSTQIYNDIRDLRLRDITPRFCSDIIVGGVLLRTSEGEYMKNVLLDRIASLLGARLLGRLDSVIIFGRRRDMKRLRKAYGATDYYTQICVMAFRSSYLNMVHPYPTLGMEEMIVLSIGTYRNFLSGHSNITSCKSMLCMFSLPLRVLRGRVQQDLSMFVEKGKTSVRSLQRCVIHEHIYGSNEQSLTLTYEGKRYTVRLWRDEVSGRIVYGCGNGITYSYCMLLLIIIHRFIFTYDRDFLIKFISQYIVVDQETKLYFDTPNSRPPIHDLIIPQNVFFGDEVTGDDHHLEMNE